MFFYYVMCSSLILPFMGIVLQESFISAVGAFE